MNSGTAKTATSQTASAHDAPNAGIHNTAGVRIEAGVSPPGVPTATSTRARAWAAVASLTAVIYLTLPFANRLWRGFQTLAAPWHEHIAAIALAAAASSAGWVLRRRLRELSLAQGAALALIAFAYAPFFASSALTPAEKTHFVYYGALALVVLRALGHDLRGRWLAPGAAAITAILGALDETIQWLLPGRHFELKDIAINALAAVLALAAASIVSTSRLVLGERP